MKKILFLLMLLSCNLWVKGQTFSWTGNLPILDFSTISVPITVSGLPSVIDTNFGLAHICMDINHTYDADLIIKMVAPNGDTITLIQNIGGSGDNFLGTCVGVDGTFFSNASAPYTGIFQPVQLTSNFNNGLNPNGVWQMIISDIANNDIGNITYAALVFVNDPPQPGIINLNNGPTGIYVWPNVQCPNNAAACDLLPDMTSSYKEIDLNHNETPGAIYISNATPNIGYGPLHIFGIDSCFCDTMAWACNVPCPQGMEKKNYIRQRIYQKVAGTDTLSYYHHTSGLMTYHEDHGHLHVDDFVDYTLRIATSNPDATTWPIVGNGTKQSFCLINLGNCATNYGECRDNNNNVVTTVPNHNLGFHTGCGVNQGIYPGNYDVYSIGLNAPILLDSSVCNGNYYIVSITDPNNNFIESDETNNWVAVPITLTQQSGSISVSANGPTTICSGDSVILTATTASSYLWSTGATTQSIVVYNTGVYSVSTLCGNNTINSNSVSVNVISSSTLPTISIAITSGANPSCNNSPVTFTATVTNEGLNPSYQWTVNGNQVGTASTFTSSTLANGDVVNCTLTSSLNCLSNPTVSANPITMIVSATSCYCMPVWGTTPTSGCMDGDVIARVTINTLDNNSGTGCPSGIAGYSDYYSSNDPSHTTTLQAGNNYSCTVWAGQYGEGYKVWIDMNDDGIFSTLEVIGNTTAIVPGSGQVGVLGSSAKFFVTIPCTAPPGNHRMRVRCSYNNNGINIDPCNYINNYGEAEDYKVTILPPPACATPHTLSATNIGPQQATLNWIAGCAETQWNLHVTNAGGGAPSGNPSHPMVGSNAFTVNNLAPSTTYEFFVSAICSPNSTSPWVGPFQFTTLTSCANTAGTSMTNPIIIGELPCITFPYVDVKTNNTLNCFTNNFTGTNNQASPDVWYQFTLSAPATVQLSHCNSGFDTYLHLLDNMGTVLFSNDDNGPLCNNTRASIVANNLAAGTYYVVCQGYSTNTGIITSKMNRLDTCSQTNVKLTCFIEGYWDGNNTLKSVLYNQGVSASVTECDSVIVALHQSTSPYNEIYSMPSILQTNGQVTALFNGITPGNYYIVVKHRNAVDTWSANPVAVETNPTVYNFTTAANKAYGNNQSQVSPGVWAFYSGDLDQNGAIDALDFLIQNVDIEYGATGNYATDLDGDGSVDVLDYLILNINIIDGTTAVTP